MSFHNGRKWILVVKMYDCVHITTHHFAFLCSESSAVGVTGVIAVAGSSVIVSPAGDVGLEGVNSPCAISKDVLSGTFAVENHPPGKKRDDVVDSILARGAEDEVSGEELLD